jgi:ATP-dependent Clp protease ATP-binding subunit ClpB
VLRAGAVLKQFNDEFVTPETPVAGIVQGNDAAAKILKNAGLSEKGLVTAIKELRKKVKTLRHKLSHRSSTR